ncbi:hypothetical protein E1281_25815 [Actinomadura sp. KC345]|uniref:hypothetical protein n=1 Tax=Actinomadura sp. KC345 TaxID=2530371 RepID=UPI0010477589|nr:hypothetical protein [Actinomadura sp. KC345]TDC47696.1 hypothetical protein E1281_25815 [Actinomadura sp. KC345]
MSVRTSFIGIGVAGTLVIGLVAGLARAHENSPPSLGNTIEVTTSPSTGGGEPRGTPDSPGATAASPDRGSSSPGPAGPSASATAGGRAVAPPPVAPDDDDDDGPGDDDDG